MMIVEVRYGSTVKQQTLYDPWDVKPEEIVLPRLALTEDRNKYVYFTDGSRLLTKLNGKYHKFLLTENGIYYRYDYVCCCRPKLCGTMYSGLFSCDEHLAVRSPTLRERTMAREYTAGKISGVKLPRRVVMLIMEDMQSHMEDQKMDGKWIIKLLKQEATSKRNRGADRLEAIKMICRIGGIEIGGMIQVKQGGALFQQFNFNTIQNQRRQQIPSQTTLDKMIELSGIRTEQPITDAVVIDS